MTITMFDTAQNNQFPAGAAAYAGYVDGGIGDQPNHAHVVSAFPAAHHLSIALFAGHDADALDVEAGAAGPSDIPGWHSRQVRRGITRPVIYASAYAMNAGVLPVLASAGIARASVRLWTAHYAGEHICGPASCGALRVSADGTQWTSNAMGRVLDQSLLLEGFFGPLVNDPVQNWTEKIMQQLPVVRQGSTGGIVRTIQGLCVARGQAVTVDGSFGAKTAAAVAGVQRAAGITADQVVGPATWPALMGI